MSCSHVHLLVVLRYCGHGHCKLHLQIHWIQRVSPTFSCTITLLRLAKYLTRFCLFFFLLFIDFFPSFLFCCVNLQSAMCGLQGREGMGRRDPWFVTKCSAFCSYSSWGGSAAHKKLEVLKRAYARMQRCIRLMCYLTEKPLYCRVHSPELTHLNDFLSSTFLFLKLCLV